MWRFKNYPDMYRLVTPLINSGLMKRPAWYDSVRISPPTHKLIDPRPPTIELPEQKLYDTLIKKQPMLELEEDKVMPQERTVAHRFVIKQLAYMEKEHLTEQAAYEKCEREFAPDIAGVENHLEDVFDDGAKRASFYKIQSNVSRYSRTADSIASLLEKRMLVYAGLKPWKSDLELEDTDRRRVAKLDRIMNDPSIRSAKLKFGTRKPPQLRVLEKLVNEPQSEDRSYYEQELRTQFRILQGKLSAVERDSSYTEADQKLFGENRRNLQRVAPELALTSRFLDLPASSRIMIINAFQCGLRYKLFPSVVQQPRYKHTTYASEVVHSMSNAREELRKVTATRTPLEIEIAHSRLGTDCEMHWWLGSAERKAMTTKLAVGREAAD